MMIEQNEKIAELIPHGYSTLKTVSEIYDVSQSTLRRYWNKGEFPEPIILFGKNRFRNADLIRFNEELTEEAT